MAYFFGNMSTKNYQNIVSCMSKCRSYSKSKMRRFWYTL